MRAERCEEGEEGWRRPNAPPPTLPTHCRCWDAVGWRLRAEDVITVVVGSHGKSPGYREAGTRFCSMPGLF